ncbi:ArnT family glycosyltransferase [Chloroflexota bacterium]
MKPYLGRYVGTLSRLLALELTPKWVRVLLLLIVAVSVVVGFWLSFYLPVLGDGCLHAYLADEIEETGAPAETLQPVVTEYEEGYPVYYPQFFHVSLSMSSMVTGTLKVLAPLLRIATILLVFLIGRDVLKSATIGLILAFVIACYPQFLLYTSTIFVESLVVFLFFATLYAHYKGVTENSKVYLLLSGLFLGAAVATKHQMLLLPIVIVVQHIWLRGGARRLLYLAVPLLFVCIPVYGHVYNSTGTVMFPTMNEAIDSIWPGKYHYSEESYDITEALLEQRGIYHVTYFNPGTLIEFFSPTTYHNYNFFNQSMAAFFTIFAVLGAIYAIHASRGKRRLLLWLLIPIIVYFPLLEFTKLTRYFLPITLLGAFSMAAAALFLKQMLGKPRLRSLAMLLLVGLFTGFGVAYAVGAMDVRDKADTMLWSPSKGKMTYVIEAYEFIDNNIDADDVVVDPNNYATLYYSSAKVCWINEYGNAEFFLPIWDGDLEGIYAQFQKNDIRYVVIRKNTLVYKDDIDSTTQFPMETYMLIKESPVFELAFERPDLEVYSFDAARVQE